MQAHKPIFSSQLPSNHHWYHLHPCFHHTWHIHIGRYGKGVVPFVDQDLSQARRSRWVWGPFQKHLRCTFYLRSYLHVCRLEASQLKKWNRKEKSGPFNKCIRSYLWPHFYLHCEEGRCLKMVYIYALLSHFFLHTHIFSNLFSFFIYLLWDD